MLRVDYQLIEQYIHEGARVLDLGCGDGSLLEQLMVDKGVTGCGIDMDIEAAKQCIRRGVPVYQGDMLDGMALLRDGAYDCVILSLTLQQTLRPARVVREMLRVGSTAIITFPNFGYWRVRSQLFLRGRMPVTRALPYTWADTPNIHLTTIKDFWRFSRDENLEIVDTIFLSQHNVKVPGWLANLFAGLAIFVLRKGPGTPGAEGEGDG